MSVTFVWHFNDAVTGLPVAGVSVHDAWAGGQASIVTNAQGTGTVVIPTDTPIAITITVPGVGSYSNPAVGVDSQFDGQTVQAIDLVDRVNSQLLQQDGERLPLTGGGGSVPASGGGNGVLLALGAAAAVAGYILLAG